jgi:hypothetical protein
MKYLIILLVFLAFFIHGAIQLDPDFGWHLRTGQIILSSGVPKIDPFTYSMPSFPYVDLSWLSDVMIAILYPRVGMFGLSIIAAIISTASLIIALTIEFGKENPKNWIFKSTLLLLGSAAIFSFEAVRIQVVSWLFLAILLKVFFENRFWYKRRLFLPGLFLLWTNMHGSFFVGLVVLFLGIIIRSLISKKVSLIDAAILVLSTLVTLINPYGRNLYDEVFRTLWGSNLSGKIMEWMPAIFSLNFPFIALVCIGTLSVWYYRKRYSPESIIIFFCFLTAAITSQRHIPLWIILCLPFLIFSYNHLFSDITKYKFGPERMKKIINGSFVGSLILFFAILALNIGSGLTENNFYPKDALNYLRQQIPSGQIFSEYGWGGYLIWKLPEKKVYIDGRMCTWFGKETKGESKNIMEESAAILSGKQNYRNLFQQYQVEIVLWPNKQANLMDRFIQKIRTKYQKEPSFSFLKQLEDDGWKKVYEDSVAVIYQKPSDF